MTIMIRPYADSDWAAISEIHDAARLDELRPSVGEEAFLDLATTYQAEGLFEGDVWVAELDGLVVGFLAYGDGEITWMYVHPRTYRRGVGRALLRHLLARVSCPVELQVLDGNDAARCLYESEGFVLKETRTGRLAGNESFAATGHFLVHRPPPAG